VLRRSACVSSRHALLCSSFYYSFIYNNNDNNNNNNYYYNYFLLLIHGFSTDVHIFRDVSLMHVCVCRCILCIYMIYECMKSVSMGVDASMHILFSTRVNLCKMSIVGRGAR
jgi:hypothetical protein